MHSPRNSHFQAANRILKYLKVTLGFGITYRKTDKLDLILYTVLDFAGSRVDYRSTMGYCTIFGGKSSDMEEQETKCSIKIKYRSKISSDVERN